MSFPKTYKHAIFKEAGGALVVEETPFQLPGKNEILVKVEACGVCHSDLFVQNNAFGVGFPIAPGHELIGRVAALGEGVVGWEEGERIGAGWHGGHDGTCTACKKGLFNMCDNQAITGITKSGGYAEYVLIRAESGVKVPADVDAAKYAPLLCAGVTVFNSIRRMGISPGETVAVEGLGGLGHLGIQYANKFGYRVVAISRGTEKEEFARQLGAHDYIDTTKADAGEALAALGGAALIVTTNPNSEKMAGLTKGLGPVGKLLILSVPDAAVPFNVASMVKRGLSIHVWPTGHAADMEETIAFSQLQEVDCLVEKFPLEKVNEAYDAMLNGTVRFRAVITME